MGSLAGSTTTTDHPQQLKRTREGVGDVDAALVGRPEEDAYHALPGVLGDAVVVVHGGEQDQGVDDHLHLKGMDGVVGGGG